MCHMCALGRPFGDCLVFLSNPWGSISAAGTKISSSTWGALKSGDDTAVEACAKVAVVQAEDMTPAVAGSAGTKAVENLTFQYAIGIEGKCVTFYF